MVPDLWPASSWFLVFGSMVACKLALALLLNRRTDSPAPVFGLASDPSLVSEMIVACKPSLAFGSSHRTDLPVLVLGPASDSDCSTGLLLPVSGPAAAFVPGHRTGLVWFLPGVLETVDFRKRC